MVHGLLDQNLVQGVVQGHGELGVRGAEKLLADQGEQIEGAHVLGLSLQGALLQEEAEQLEGLQADGFVVTVEELHDGANALFVVECRYHAWRMLVHQCHYQLQHVDHIFVLLMERPRIRNVNKEQELKNDIFQCCFL